MKVINPTEAWLLHLRQLYGGLTVAPIGVRVLICDAAGERDPIDITDQVTALDFLGVTWSLADDLPPPADPEHSVQRDGPPLLAPLEDQPIEVMADDDPPPGLVRGPDFAFEFGRGAVADPATGRILDV